MFGPDPIGEDVIGSVLSSSWRLEADSVEYAAIGYGSYHWHASGDGARWLVTADLDDERPVVAAYELTHRLGERFGFVRSPLANRDGGVVVGQDDWVISVWPWVDGAPVHSVMNSRRPKLPRWRAVCGCCMTSARFLLLLLWSMTGTSPVGRRSMNCSVVQSLEGTDRMRRRSLTGLPPIGHDCSGDCQRFCVNGVV